MLDSLVQLDDSMPGITLDIRLATDNNFTGQQIYTKAKAYVHRDTAKKLETARRIAATLGLQLHIWDTFRPLEAQQKLWNYHPDSRYISPPDNGPRTHCRGIAVDLTLESVKTGELLDMGTGFDDFREIAHHNNTSISDEALRNRLTLAGLMHTAGFRCHPYEWWHYELPTLDRYPVLTDRLAGTHLMGEEGKG
ncbi:D-alanyl-D-alanine dipeptidase [Parendozoicomonas sp. Alg238-R29]|uniref:D-alanyl-D-alanine dipeptidase n=1 Tax=Parendozoicomonas sp. Alg238-R29 TaxID=2993446 RepID=UPI00248F2778|nr:D-alanyl-D-alanine dipeptidase [Parendozoicomonas sp. Alg238-R29]